jgi:hypothetical protein
MKASTAHLYLIPSNTDNRMWLFRQHWETFLIFISSSSEKQTQNRFCAEIRDEKISSFRTHKKKKLGIKLTVVKSDNRYKKHCLPHAIDSDLYLHLSQLKLHPSWEVEKTTRGSATAEELSLRFEVSKSVSEGACDKRQSFLMRRSGGDIFGSDISSPPNACTLLLRRRNCRVARHPLNDTRGH